MEIYGMGIISLCMFIGTFLGNLLGELLGVSGDVGGVGMAMLLLVLISNYMESKGKPFPERIAKGIEFVSCLYIPIVVAMASIQNVLAAFKGGAVAFLAGGLATIGSMLLIPLISRSVHLKKVAK
ncbi:malonate transporter subunit MadL [Thermosediminibacter litoriperuensis]|uniref:Malonate transporter MadL subunit n=1 Tax=Thermosediminibacter litoriperuensis TaxID=291989 RepID=A0A5S5AWT0_9FIRM|nr:malonate transporter subunit MadL [Thermosediminibacter litoriperuensis]TYP57809.1 malonate transporter MadL subunit [Thermosediminibacter litoriperuensis]